MAAAGATAPETGAKWIWDWKTGYRRVTPGIISGPEVKKVPLPTGGELWGPYKKVYADGFFGRNFTPPSTVDGIPILCQCRDIHNYMRTEGGSGGLSLGAGGAVLFGGKPPACWDYDSKNFLRPDAGETFHVEVNPLAFKELLLNPGGIMGIVTGSKSWFNLLRGAGRKTTARKGRSRKQRPHRLRKQQRLHRLRTRRTLRKIR